MVTRIYKVFNYNHRSIMNILTIAVFGIQWVADRYKICMLLYSDRGELLGNSVMSSAPGVKPAKARKTNVSRCQFELVWLS